MLEVPDWGLASWSWFGYGHLSLMYPWSKFWLSILLLKGKRTYMSINSSFGALEDAGGSWLGFGILIFIWILSLVFDTIMIQILALYLDFKGAKNIHVLLVLIWGFGGCRSILTGVWHLDIDLNMVTGLSYTHVPNFASLSWFWRCKEHLCPLSPDLWLWRTLEVPHRGLASWSWFGYGLGSLTGLWLLALAPAFGFGFDFCTVESRKYVDPGSGSGGFG